MPMRPLFGSTLSPAPAGCQSGFRGESIRRDNLPPTHLSEAGRGAVPKTWNQNRAASVTLQIAMPSPIRAEGRSGSWSLTKGID